jgi:hypothetical protein
MQRQLEGTVEADELYHTAGNKGQATHGGKKHLGRRARGRRKKREPGRGHYDKDRPAIIAWVSRQGSVVVQAARDFTVKTVQKAADIAVQAGSRLYTDSASSYRALKGSKHEYVNHTQKAYARGEVHENRSECVFSLLKPYLRVFRGVSKFNQPARVCRVLSVPAELPSAERIRAGGADLAGGARPRHCKEGQKGRICQVF